MSELQRMLKAMECGNSYAKDGIIKLFNDTWKEVSDLCAKLEVAETALAVTKHNAEMYKDERNCQIDLNNILSKENIELRATKQERDNLQKESKQQKIVITTLLEAINGWKIENNNLQAHIKELEDLAIYNRESTTQFWSNKYDNLQAANGVLREWLNKTIDAAEYANRQVQSESVINIIERSRETLFIAPEKAGERVQWLVDSLEKLARLGNGDRYGNSIGNVIAKDALVKYRG